MQVTSKLLMVSPVCFGFNPQTAENNVFQKDEGDNSTQGKALAEFDEYVSLLKSHNVEVVEVKDTLAPHTPDSIFPNNWFTTHASGTLVLYPMYAPNRRDERKQAVLDAIYSKCSINRVVDLTSYEQQGLFLEGTGSMVLDRINNIAYAVESPRTSRIVLDKFCEEMGFIPILFDSMDGDGIPIYHTNVMMSLGTEFAVICLESIRNAKQREIVVDSIEKSGREILNITFEQVRNYAGNMLEICSKNMKSIMVMSQTAKKSLTNHQLEIIEKKHEIISPNLNTIEFNGGGSARCMLAELY